MKRPVKEIGKLQVFTYGSIDKSTGIILKSGNHIGKIILPGDATVLRELATELNAYADILEPPKHEIDFTRIESDSNGNPRYVCHFLELLTAEEQEQFNKDYGISAISMMYAFAVKRANKIGGRKYSNRSYGGGIVFQSYSLDELTNSIRRVKGEV